MNANEWWDDAETPDGEDPWDFHVGSRLSGADDPWVAAGGDERGRD